jgi:hypothetical protein
MRPRGLRRDPGTRSDSIRCVSPGVGDRRLRKSRSVGRSGELFGIRARLGQTIDLKPPTMCSLWNFNTSCRQSYGQRVFLTFSRRIGTFTPDRKNVLPGGDIAPTGGLFPPWPSAIILVSSTEEGQATAFCFTARQDLFPREEALVCSVCLAMSRRLPKREAGVRRKARSSETVLGSGMRSALRNRVPETNRLNSYGSSLPVRLDSSLTVFQMGAPESVAKSWTSDY